MCSHATKTHVSRAIVFDQAEDGIRDLTVTGVQTCALPISQFGKLLLGWKQAMDRAALDCDAIGELERLYKTINAECDANPARLEEAKQELVKLQGGRSEERRVGKECRSRWSPHH